MRPQFEKQPGEPGPDGSLPQGVTLTNLENGLTIIVREDHSAPVVSAQAWCQAGSIHEGEHLGAGMSHVLEHMLFKGTTNRPGNRIDQEVQEAGGYMNAYTSFDRTVYHIDVPSTGTRVAIDVLCDIMQNATLPEQELEKEKDVIRREMDMNVDDPGRRASRRLFETAYTRSPFRYTVIGYPDLFNELTRDNIVGYYREKYAPNNVFYVIAGDVQPDEVLAQIRTAYAGAKARALPISALPAEPRQTAPRALIERAPIELGHLHMAWHVPDLRHPDMPILDVLAVMLGNGRSSRLYRSVRQDLGLVHSIDAWSYTPGEVGLFGVSATVEGEKFAAAREAALGEIEKMKVTPVLPEELGKAVKQFISATLATRKTMQGQAQDLGGSWLAANDLSFSQRYLAAVRRVTPEDITRVARQYLTAENRTVYALLPSSTEAPPLPGVEVSTDRPIQKFDLANGLRLLVKEDRRLPFVEFRAVFQGGVLAESTTDSGVTQLASKMLLKGTTRRSAEQIALTIESLGGSIDTYGGNNTFGVNAEVLNGDFNAGLELLTDVLLNPSFPPDALERERQTQLAAIRAQKDQLLQSAFQLMRRNLFGATSYGLDALGTEESVQQLREQDLRSFHGRMVSPDNAVLAVYGDVDAEATRRAVDAAFAEWQAKTGLGWRVPQAPEILLPSIRRVEEAREKKQAVVVMGFKGCSLRDSQRYALDLLQEACSDLGSRLFMRIREELGLAYYVGAQNFVGVTPGFVAFYAGTAPEHAARVEQELLAEVAALRTDGLSADELRRAKAKIIGQRRIGRQDLGALALATALDELHGLGYDQFTRDDALYEAVTSDDVKRAAVQFLDPQAHVVAVLTGPKST